MQSGVVGLGCIGVTISRRLMKAGHSSVGWDANPVGALSAMGFGFGGHAGSAKE